MISFWILWHYESAFIQILLTFYYSFLLVPQIWEKFSVGATVSVMTFTYLVVLFECLLLSMM